MQHVCYSEGDMRVPCMVHVQYFELGLYTPLYSTCLLMNYSFPYVVISNF